MVYYIYNINVVNTNKKDVFTTQQKTRHHTQYYCTICRTESHTTDGHTSTSTYITATAIICKSQRKMEYAIKYNSTLLLLRVRAIQTQIQFSMEKLIIYLD